MLEFKKNQKRLPFGGHHHPAYGIVFRGETLAEVVKKIEDYRINNHLAIGNPEQEVLERYQKLWPWLVKTSEDKEPTPEKSQAYKDWRFWVDRLWANPPIKVLTIKEARLRWDVCLKCPFNQKPDWKDDRETAEIKRRLYLLRRGVDVPEDLGICALHKADLSVLSFLENPENVSLKKDGEKPKDCWVSDVL